MWKRAFVLLCLVILAGCAYFSGHATCSACMRPLHGETSFRLTLDNGEELELCCARCGLHVQQSRSDVAAAQTADFYSQQLMPVGEAWFVENSTVVLCRDHRLQRDRSGGQFDLDWDRCMPSLISFRTREEASDFQRNNGGTVTTFAQLIEQGSHDAGH